MQLQILLWLAAVVGVLSQVHAPRITVADEPPRASIWGRTIAAEPFDKSPFHEIRIPEWVQETVGVGYTLSVQNAEQRQRAVKAGVTISEMNFVDPFHVFYDSKLRAFHGLPAGEIRPNKTARASTTTSTPRRFTVCPTTMSRSAKRRCRFTTSG